MEWTTKIINQIKFQSGFTLIELLVAISIFLAIGTFSTNFYTGFLRQNAVLNTQDQLLGALRKAQIYAMVGKRGTNWGVHYDSGTKKITLFRGTQWLGHSTDSDEVFNVNPNLSVTGVTEVIFTRLTGIPNIYGTITISDGKTTKYVSINSQGVATR